MGIRVALEKRRISRLRADLTCRDNRQPGAPVSIHNLHNFDLRSSLNIKSSPENVYCLVLQPEKQWGMVRCGPWRELVTRQPASTVENIKEDGTPPLFIGHHQRHLNGKIHRRINCSMSLKLYSPIPKLYQIQEDKRCMYADACELLNIFGVC